MYHFTLLSLRTRSSSGQWAGMKVYTAPRPKHITYTSFKVIMIVAAYLLCIAIEKGKDTCKSLTVYHKRQQCKSERWENWQCLTLQLWETLFPVDLIQSSLPFCLFYLPANCMVISLISVISQLHVFFFFVACGCFLLHLVFFGGGVAIIVLMRKCATCTRYSRSSSVNTRCKLM